MVGSQHNLRNCIKGLHSSRKGENHRGRNCRLGNGAKAAVVVWVTQILSDWPGHENIYPITYTENVL